MKRLFSSAFLVLAAVAMPASAALQMQSPLSQTGLPPGCFWVPPLGPVLCVDMPIEGG
jgi:hypothetical protein